MSFIKVKDKDYLIRDMESNAVINVDIDAYNLYCENYKQKYNQLQKIKNLETDIHNIRNDLDEIKQLLRNLNGSN